MPQTQPLNIVYRDDILTAQGAIRSLTPAMREKADSAISEILAAKSRLEELAVKKGYSEACKQAIPTCGGECCIYHYPVNLTPVDFFIALYTMPVERQKALLDLVSRYKGKGCPMLLKTGCFFSFRQRPIVCTISYPCFADRSYWKRKETESVRIKEMVSILTPIVRSSAAQSR